MDEQLIEDYAEEIPLEELYKEGFQLDEETLELLYIKRQKLIEENAYFEAFYG